MSSIASVIPPLPPDMEPGVLQNKGYINTSDINSRRQHLDLNHVLHCLCDPTTTPGHGTWSIAEQRIY